jgi:hypothetical protein
MIAVNKKMAGTGLIVLALVIAIWSIVSSKSEKVFAQHPDAAHAFQELYGTPQPIAKFTVDKNHLASVWFEQALNDGVTDLFVVLTKRQQLEDSGELVSCHACGTSIDVITYVHKPDGWVKEAVLKDIAQLGAYGDVPKISSAKVLQLSVGNIALAISSVSSGQGTTNHGEILLNHFQGRWSEIGYLDIAGNNFGTLCRKEGEQLNSDEYSSNPCYSYKSTYKLQAGESLIYPNILVSRRGQDFSIETGKVEKVGDDIYVFDGKQYLSSQQMRESTRRTELQNKASQPVQPDIVPQEPRLSKAQAEQAMEGLTRKLSYCILPAAQYGQYSSFDGGKSASTILLEKCPADTFAWIDNCMAAGSSKEQCMTSALVMTQVAIKSFGK